MGRVSPETRLLDAIFGPPVRSRVRVKVNTVGRDSLCNTCTNSTIMRGENQMQEITFCQDVYPHVQVPFPVRDCNAYKERNTVTLHEMREIAWTLKTDKGRAIGFAPPTVKKVVEIDDDLGPAS